MEVFRKISRSTKYIGLIGVLALISCAEDESQPESRINTSILPAGSGKTIVVRPDPSNDLFLSEEFDPLTKAWVSAESTTEMERRIQFDRKERVARVVELHASGCHTEKTYAVVAIVESEASEVVDEESDFADFLPEEEVQKQYNLIFKQPPSLSLLVPKGEQAQPVCLARANLELRRLEKKFGSRGKMDSKSLELKEDQLVLGEEVFRLLSDGDF